MTVLPAACAVLGGKLIQRPLSGNRQTNSIDRDWGALVPGSSCPEGPDGSGAGSRLSACGFRCQFLDIFGGWAGIIRLAADDAGHSRLEAYPSFAHQPIGAAI